MGKTQRAHMMGLKVYLLIALAVSCHGLPRTTEEVVPERQTMLLQYTAAFTSMSPTPPLCNPNRCSAKGSNHPFCYRSHGYCCQNHPGGSTGEYSHCVRKTRFN